MANNKTVQKRFRLYYRGLPGEQYSFTLPLTPASNGELAITFTTSTGITSTINALSIGTPGLINSLDGIRVNCYLYNKLRFLVSFQLTVPSDPSGTKPAGYYIDVIVDYDPDTTGVYGRKADKSLVEVPSKNEVYTKAEVDAIISSKPDSADIYEKSDYVILSGTVTNVPGRGTSTVTYSLSQLAQFGITADNIDDLEVLAFSVKDTTAVWSRKYSTQHAWSNDGRYDALPSIKLTYVDTYSLAIQIYNPSASTADYDYRVVLLKL